MPSRARARPTCVSVRLVDRALRLRRLKGPVRPIGVERHRQALGAQHGGQTRHHGPSCSRSDRTPRAGRVWSHRRTPAIKHGRASASPVNQRARCHRDAAFRRNRRAARAAADGGPAPVLLHQPGRLQRLFHQAVRHRHPVLAPRDLMKVPHIEPAHTAPIQPQHPLDLRRRHPPLRRPQQAACRSTRHSPWSSYRSRHRRSVRGDHPRMSAARNQCSSPLIAFNITSWTVIARSHAASGYGIEPPQLLSYPRPAAGSGQITCSRERSDHVLPTAEPH